MVPKFSLSTPTPREFPGLDRPEDDHIFTFVKEKYSMTSQLLSTFFEGNVFPLRPVYDIDETEENYVLSVDLPGIPKDEIKLELKDAALQISAERKTRDGQAKGYAKFEQGFDLPQGTSFEKIEAQYQDGVLKVTIPKAAEAKARLIQIA
jgi:HSP20 family protein